MKAFLSLRLVLRSGTVPYFRIFNGISIFLLLNYKMIFFQNPCNCGKRQFFKKKHFVRFVIHYHQGGRVGGFDRQFLPLNENNRLCPDSSDGVLRPCAQNLNQKSNQNFEPAEEHEYPWQIFVESPQKSKGSLQ